MCVVTPKFKKLVMSSKKCPERSSFGDVCANSERYVLILSLEKAFGTEQKPVKKFLQDSVTNISRVNNECGDKLGFPQRKHHIAVVDPASCHGDQTTDADWLTLDHLHKGSTPKNGRRSSGRTAGSLGTQEGLDNPEIAETNDDELDVAFAESIHALADKLPITGHYLDTVWLATSSTNVPIADHISLYGALQRLCSWHNGLLTVVCEGANPDGPHNSTLNEWVNQLHGRVVGSVEEAMGQGVAWRGEILLADGKGQKSLSIPGFALSPCVNDKPEVQVGNGAGDGGCMSPRAKSSRSHTARKIMTFSSQLEVVCSVRTADVPSIFLSPVTLSLHLLPGSRLPRSEHFLHWMVEVSQSQDAAVIVRLRCKTLTPSGSSARNARPLSTKVWKEHVKNCSGDLKVPDLRLRESQEFFYLLVHGSSGHGQDVTANLMHSPHDLSGAAHAQLAKYQESLAYDDHQNAKAMLNTVASLDGGQVQALLETIKLAQAEAIRTFTEERRSESGEPTITLGELQLLMGTVYASAMAEIDDWSKTVNTDDDVCPEASLKNENVISELDLSPSSWMERFALQNHEALERKIKRFKSGEMMLAGLPVPAPADNTITLTADEFLKHFQSSGLPSADDLSPISVATEDRPSSVTARNSCPTLPWSKIMKATFEEAQKYTVPGILYCLDSGRNQKIDSHFSKMQQRYIRYETASTCSSEQAASPATLTIPQPSSSATDPTPATVNPTAAATAATARIKGHPQGDRHGVRGQRLATKDRGVVDRGQRSAEKGQRFMRVQRSAEKRRRMVLDRSRKISPGRTFSRGLKRKGEDKVSPAKKRLVPRRTSPRKRVTGKEKPDATPLAEKTNEDPRTAPLPSSSLSSSKPRKMSRSDRTRMKLREIVKESIVSRGITKENDCYKACLERLYRMAELYVKDLKTCKGLDGEMKKIAEANADFVVQFERNRIKKS